MGIRLESGSHLPVYVQLKEQIRFLILSGELAPGAKLPTIRQLTGFLRINRNTVLKAYQELVREGLIECRQGQGCVVRQQPAPVSQTVSGSLLGIIDRAIEEASDLGVSAKDFAVFAYARASQRQDVRVRRRLAFVECEARIAAAFARVIEKRLDVEVIPIVLRDLQHPTPEVQGCLRDVHLVATTFFHIQEVRRLLAKAKQEIVGLGVGLPLDTLVRISEIPAEIPVAMVCATAGSALNMKQSLENAGIKHLNSAVCGADNVPNLRETLRGAPIVILSDLVAEEVRPLLQPDQQVVVLDYMTLDEGGISLLRAMMAEEPAP